MNAKQISVYINLATLIGHKTARLDGYAFLDSGFLVGDFRNGGDLTAEEVALLSAFTYTGCPIVARSSTPGLNPWIATGGAYESRRVLSLPLAQVKSSLRSEKRGNVIHMNLDVVAEGIVPRLRGIPLPFQEAIHQSSRGNLSGKFDLEFEDQDGHCHVGTARTEYFLDIDFDAPAVWRNILVVTASEGNSHKQIEQIDLFSSQEVADSDLSDKLSVARTVTGCAHRP